MSNFFRNRNTLGKIPTLIPVVSGGSSEVGNWTQLGSTNYYYLLCGNFYVLTQYNNSYSYLHRNDATTIAKLESDLSADGITVNSWIASPYNMRSYLYWNGSAWVSSTSGYSTLIGFTV